MQSVIPLVGGTIQGTNITGNLTGGYVVSDTYQNGTYSPSTVNIFGFIGNTSFTAEGASVLNVGTDGMSNEIDQLVSITQCYFLLGSWPVFQHWRPIRIPLDCFRRRRYQLCQRKSVRGVLLYSHRSQNTSRILMPTQIVRRNGGVSSDAA
jgi:hypothetical protein